MLMLKVMLLQCMSQLVAQFLVSRCNQSPVKTRVTTAVNKHALAHGLIQAKEQQQQG